MQCFSFPKYVFRRGYQKKILKFIFVLLFMCFFYYISHALITLYVSLFTCSFKDVQDAIRSICDSYYSNVSFGNMCSSMCITGKLRPIRCVTHHSGKEIVFDASWNNERVVVKSSYKNASKFEQIYLEEKGISKPLYPDLPTFFTMLVKSVETNLRIALNEDERSPQFLITKLWSLSYAEFMKLPNNQLSNAMNNVWYLVQQQEYLLAKMYDTKRVFPRILGTCGHFSAIEYFTPLDSYFSVLHPFWRHSVQQRVTWALEILHFLHKLESNFEKPMHLCDVKISHFGFNMRGETRFIDLDMIYPEDSLKQNLLINKCKNECSFIHCLGSCNRSIGFCTEEIRNSNFQRICHNIFHGFTWKMEFGLLSQLPEPYNHEIKEIINSCASHNASLSKIYSSKLQNLLKEVT